MRSALATGHDDAGWSAERAGRVRPEYLCTKAMVCCNKIVRQIWGESDKAEVRDSDFRGCLAATKQGDATAR